MMAKALESYNQRKKRIEGDTKLKIQKAAPNNQSQLETYCNSKIEGESRTSTYDDQN